VGGWAQWVFPVLSVLVIGIPATLYLHRVHLPREEAAAGVAALAGMRWRDFIHLVLDALIRRGYERTFEPNASGEEGDYVLERGGQRYLLSSKHGAAYVLGSTAIAEFANAIRMHSLAGGLLVTPGQFAPEAHPLARAQRIELIDGPTLWPELRPLLPQEQRDAISAPARADSRRQVLLAWALGLALGVALFLIMRGAQPQPAPVASDGPVAGATANASVPATTTPAHPATTPPPAATRTARASAISAADMNDPAQLARRRKAIAQSISSLPLVDRAVWETQSTLLVQLVDDTSNPLPSICPLLEQYDELAATRLQLQPPPGSSRPVRFVQCQAY
jgi:restriction system protein